MSDGCVLIGEKRMLLTKDVSAASVRSLLQAWEYDFAVIASVVPACVEALRAGIGAACHFLNSASPHGICFDDYPDHAHLGADRLANVLALKQAPRFPAIAIDVGTAVTYDILDVGRCGDFFFLGGVIAPGLSTLRTCLSSATALLPSVDASQPQQWIGKNTIQALQSGATLGFVGMVRETIAALTLELGCDPYFVVTGGDATIVASEVSQVQQIDADLTLNGLRMLAKCL
ncbi:MAG: type III pantothenate kinase [Akkermansia sp.]